MTIQNDRIELIEFIQFSGYAKQQSISIYSCKYHCFFSDDAPLFRFAFEANAMYFFVGWPNAVYLRNSSNHCKPSGFHGSLNSVKVTYLDCFNLLWLPVQPQILQFVLKSSLETKPYDLKHVNCVHFSANIMFGYCPIPIFVTLSLTKIVIIAISHFN